MNRDSIIEKLIRADEEAFFSKSVAPGKKASVIIIGGSAMMLHDLSVKQVTKDVDVLEVENSIREVLLSDPNFNMSCQAYCLSLPYNYEDRLLEVPLDLRVIRVFTPSLEDLAVMKLYRWEEPDIADLTSTAFIDEIDFDLLDYLILDPSEAAASRISLPEQDIEFQNLLNHYNIYKSEYLS